MSLNPPHIDYYGTSQTWISSNGIYYPGPEVRIGHAEFDLGDYRFQLSGNAYLSGTVIIVGDEISGLADPVYPSSAVNLHYLETNPGFLYLGGDNANQNINIGSYSFIAELSRIGAGVCSFSGATYLSGNTAIRGGYSLSAHGAEISGVKSPTYPSAAANKDYVDDAVTNISGNFYPSSVGAGISGTVSTLVAFSSNSRNLYTGSSQVNKNYIDNISSNTLANTNFSSNAKNLYYNSSSGYWVSSNYYQHSSNRDVHFPSSAITGWLDSVYLVTGAFNITGANDINSWNSTDWSNSGLVWNNGTQEWDSIGKSVWLDTGTIAYVPDREIVIGPANYDAGAYCFQASGDAHFSSNVDVEGELTANKLLTDARIEHTGDSNTYMRFTGDHCEFQVGGDEFLTMDESGTDFTHFNLKGKDIDFRVSGNTDTLIWGDAGTDKVGIGTSSPAYKLHVEGSISSQMYSGSVSTKGLYKNITSKTAAYTATAKDDIIFCSGGTFNITLPTPAGMIGKEYTIKNIGSGGSVITVSGSGAEPIDYDSSKELKSLDSMTIIAHTSSQWFVI